MKISKNLQLPMLTAFALAAVGALAIDPALAAPIPLQPRTLTDGVEALYDDTLKVTWLKDANLFATQYQADNNIITAILAGRDTIWDPSAVGGGIDRNFNPFPDDTLYHLTPGSSDGTVAGDFSDLSAGTPFPINGAISFYAARAYVKWLNEQQYGGFSDWRLPKVAGSILQCGFKINEELGFTDDGSTDAGRWIISPKSELSHLYYVTLENSFFDRQGQLTNKVFSAGTPPGDFSNLQHGLDQKYWFRTDDIAGSAAWAFEFRTGLQLNSQPKINSAYVMVLRDGDTNTVPNNTQYSDPDPAPGFDADPCTNSPPEVSADDKVSTADDRLDFTVGQAGTVSLTGSDADNHKIKLMLKRKLPGLGITADEAQGKVTGTASWTPPPRFADKKVAFSVQAKETTKADHTEVKKVLLKSAPLSVYLRVFPAGKDAATGTRLVKVTQASWDATNSKLKVQGTVAPLRILTADEITALFATEHAVTLDTVKSDNSKEAITVDPITVTNGAWTTEISTLTTPPCRIAANFTGTASKAKAVRGAPKATCTK